MENHLSGLSAFTHYGDQGLVMESMGGEERQLPYLDYHIQPSPQEATSKDLHTDLVISSFLPPCVSEGHSQSVGLNDPLEGHATPDKTTTGSYPEVMCYTRAVFLQLYRTSLDLALGGDPMDRDVMQQYRRRLMFLMMVNLPPPLYEKTNRARWSDLSVGTMPDGGLVLQIKEECNEADNDSDSSPTSHRISQRILRHSLAEMCPVGALGFLLHSYFNRGGESSYSLAMSVDTSPWLDHPLYDSDENERNLLSAQYFFDVHVSADPVPPDHQDESEGMYLCEFNSKRDLLVPPSDLMFFPWALLHYNRYNDLVEARVFLSPKDLEIYEFLGVLLFLSNVVLQDAVVLSLKYPSHPLLQSHPFCSPRWQEYVAYSKSFLEAPLQEDEHRDQEKESSQDPVDAADFLDILDRVLEDENISEIMAALRDKASTPHSPVKAKVTLPQKSALKRKVKKKDPFAREALLDHLNNARRP